MIKLSYMGGRGDPFKFEGYDINDKSKWKMDWDLRDLIKVAFTGDRLMVRGERINGAMEGWMYSE